MILVTVSSTKEGGRKVGRAACLLFFHGHRCKGMTGSGDTSTRSATAPLVCCLHINSHTMDTEGGGRGKGGKGGEATARWWSQDLCFSSLGDTVAAAAAAAGGEKDDEDHC
jgi:hypothetical protein